MSYVLTFPTDSNGDHSYSIMSGRIQPNEPSPDYMKKFDDILCDFLKEQGVPGASLFITYHGKPIYRQGYGISECGELISSSSHFRIASISKVLTAIAVLRLCEEGVLSLGKRVFGDSGILRKMKPSTIIQVAKRNQLGNITVRDLLQHSSGWDREKDGDHVFWFQKEPHKSEIDAWDNEALVSYVLSYHLSFTPGSRHEYSNFGYLILGMIIEEVSGIPYEDYVRTILREIGIEDIHIGNTKQDKVHHQEVKYYNNKDPTVEASVFGEDEEVCPQYGSFPMENTGAYGGWVACAQDLVTILNNFKKPSDPDLPGDAPSLLRKKTVLTMLTRPKYAKGLDWYGLGLDVEDNGLSYGHTGAMEGTSATVHHNQSGLTWALLLNSWAKDMDLDGLIKYALSSVQGLPLWNGIDFTCNYEDYFIKSQDGLECITILLPHKQLLKDVLEMKESGYRISWINALRVDKETMFNIIWQKDTSDREWSIFIDVEVENFNECLRNMKENWEIIFMESYFSDEILYHLFVFREGNHTPQKVYVVDNVTKHLQFKAIYESKGFVLQTQSVLIEKDLTLISAVYNKVTSKSLSSKIWIDVSMEDFMDQLAKYFDNKLKLVYLQFYTTNDMPKISAVWHPVPVRTNMFQRHDVTKYGFLYELGESMKCNRPVSFLSAYRYEDVTYFVAVWEIYFRTGI